MFTFDCDCASNCVARYPACASKCTRFCPRGTRPNSELWVKSAIAVHGESTTNIIIYFSQHKYNRWYIWSKRSDLSIETILLAELLQKPRKRICLAFPCRPPGACIALLHVLFHLDPRLFQRLALFLLKPWMPRYRMPAAMMPVVRWMMMATPPEDQLVYSEAGTCCLPPPVVWFAGRLLQVMIGTCLGSFRLSTAHNKRNKREREIPTRMGLDMGWWDQWRVASVCCIVVGRMHSNMVE